MFGQLLTVGTCACAKLADTPSESGWPRCDGVLRLYPSGNISCDCGDHNTEQTGTEVV